MKVSLADLKAAAKPISKEVFLARIKEYYKEGSIYEHLVAQLASRSQEDLISLEEQNQLLRGAHKACAGKPVNSPLRLGNIPSRRHPGSVIDNCRGTLVP
jgi:hypothetical protein